ARQRAMRDPGRLYPLGNGAVEDDDGDEWKYNRWSLVLSHGVLDNLRAVTCVAVRLFASSLDQETPMAPIDDPSRRPTALTWPERIENYRKQIGVPYLGHENGWTYGTWFIGNSYEKKTDYYGGFQGSFLKRIAALFPDRRRVLHLFAGRVDLDRFPG